MGNSADNVFQGIPARPDEGPLFRRFIQNHDLSPHTLRALVSDLRKFANWYVCANNEPFETARVTTRDVADFRDFLRRQKKQAVSTTNRTLCSIRKFLGFLVAHGHLPSNAAKEVKELRRQQLAPQGLERGQVRKLLREVELRHDVRSHALFCLMLYTGARVSDVVSLELHDLLLAERSGHVVYRLGKGGKQRTVPLPLPARRALQAYLDVRPPIDTSTVFIGERGPLTDRGVRALCRRYSTLVGFRIHPHLLRHTFAHRFLADTRNDLVALAQILGHSDLNTAARYTQRTAAALAEASERLDY